MSAGVRIALPEARALALEVVALLHDSCHRVEIAGSIRRRKLDIGDIEIVAIPKVLVESGGLFGDVNANVDLLDNRCLELITRGTFEARRNKNGQESIGPRNKFLLYKDFALDVFSTTRQGWGVTLAIRTGPADFNKRLVTRKSQGGWCPEWLQVKVGEGVICRRDDGEILPTPDERDVFAALSLPWREPEERL